MLGGAPGCTVTAARRAKLATYCFFSEANQILDMRKDWRREREPPRMGKRGCVRVLKASES